MTLFTAFTTLLYRYSGQNDICVGTPIANRTRADIEKLIGYFANTLVLRSQIGDNTNFRQQLAETTRKAREAYAHQDLPFEQLVEALQPERSPSHTPIFQVMFTLQNAPTGDATWHGLKLTPFGVQSGTTRFDLTLGMMDTATGLAGMVEYNTDLFDAETIGRLIGYFQVLLKQVTDDPDCRLNDVNFLTDGERYQLLHEWNNTAIPYAADSCLHHLFEAQAQKYPDSVALVFESREFTYLEVNWRSNQLARQLQSMGVGPEVIVAVAFDRSVELIISLLAILKAGGAYLSLISTLPQERIAFILDDARPKLILTSRHLADKFSGNPTQILCVDLNWNEQNSYLINNPSSTAGSQNVAYLVYTSGTTGQPKASMLAHQGIVNLSLAMIHYYGLRPGKRVLQFLSSSFDTFAQEVFPTLASGATLVLHRNPTELLPSTFLDEIERLVITTLHIPPAYLVQLAQELSLSQRSLPQSLELVITGAESLPLDSLVIWQQHSSPTAKFINAYGPTEATVTATAFALCARVDQAGDGPFVEGIISHNSACQDRSAPRPGV